MFEESLVPKERVERAILVLRGHRVVLDEDLAVLYGVTTKRLNEQVKRNAERFPPDFVFQLTMEEHASLRSQSATLDVGRGRHRKFRPYAFTEHGALMAASVLSSARAIEMSLMVVRAFVRLRRMLQADAGLARKLEELEKKYDAQFRVVFDAIRELMAPPAKQKKRIGFGEG